MKKMLLICCGLALAAAVQAQIIHVPADYPTIQQGINAATPGDTVLVAEGTYYEQINFKGKKPLTVASEFIKDGDTSHIRKTIIDGSKLTNKDSASVVYFISGEDTTSILCGFKITGGRGTITDFNGAEPSRAGGGIWISSSGATIRNNQVSGNRCENLTATGLSTIGGGIASAWEQEENWIIIENNIIDNNVATTNQPDGWIYGGGISIGNNCRIIDNIIRNNVLKGLVVSSGWAQGGGVMVVSNTSLNRQAIIRNNLFEDNSVNSNLAYTGGLLVCNMLLSCSGNSFIGNRAESDLSITTVGAGGMAAWGCIGGTVISGNTFKQNYSEGWVGGLEIESQENIAGTILVENNYFFNNTAKIKGGAFETWGVPVKLQNNVFSGNHSERGGAISLERGSNTNVVHLATLINNSFSRNTASFGGAIASTDSKPLIINSIFWGDSAAYGREIYLIGNDKVEIANTTIDPAFVKGTLINGGDIFFDDPMFTDSVSLTLAQSSPCINKGTLAFTCQHKETYTCPLYDITGAERPLGTSVDIGAYEYDDPDENAFQGPQFNAFYHRVMSVPESERTAIVDSFMKTIPSFPFVEVKTVAYFLYRKGVYSVNVPGDANNWNSKAFPMTKIPGTNLWYYEAIFEPDARLDYQFVVNNSAWILDPLNPNKVTGGFGPNSELAMPDYIQPPEIKFYPDIPHGTLTNLSISSSILGNSRSVRIYTPPSYLTAMNDSFPVILIHDGNDFINLANANNVMDYLISGNHISPVIAVFVPPVNRDDEYAYNRTSQFESFIIDELMPVIDSQYRTRKDPTSRAMLGISFGGLISTQICYNRPESFGLCAPLSPAYDPLNHRVFDQVMNGPKKEIKIYLDWGSYETTIMMDGTMLRDRLLDNGYEIKWNEWHDGHSWGNWRAHLDIALEYFFPANVGIDDVGYQMSDVGCLIYPNPFTGSTTFTYKLIESTQVSLKVFNSLGVLVAEPVNEFQPNGEQKVIWNAEGLPSGIYYCRLQAGNQIRSGKIMKIK